MDDVGEGGVRRAALRRRLPGAEQHEKQQRQQRSERSPERQEDAAPVAGAAQLAQKLAPLHPPDTPACGTSERYEFYGRMPGVKGIRRYEPAHGALLDP